VPGELGDVALCRWMGWSYRELMEAPEQWIEDIRMWMNKRALLQKERAEIERIRRRRK
jgi:hypothetical protein